MHVLVMPGGDCERYPGHDCILRVRGPFASPGEAREAFEEALATGERPHLMSVDPGPGREEGGPDGQADPEAQHAPERGGH
jgi:hypothetical protein